MADTNAQKLEREYVIPLRRATMKVPAYRRSGRAVKAIKQFIAKHMKVADRNTDNVKIDMYFNNEIWMRGKTNPPAKVKVKAVKEGDIVKVTFVEMPKRVEFLKAKHGKIHKQVAAQTTQSQPKTEEKTEEQKTEEKEKEKAVAEASQTEAKKQAKADKHVTKAEKTQRPQRMALQK